MKRRSSQDGVPPGRSEFASGRVAPWRPAAADVQSGARESVPAGNAHSHRSRVARVYVIRSIGGATATLLMWVLCDAADYGIALVPFVTSIIMVFGSPESPLAQPRNLIGGHIISSAVTLLTVSVLGYQPWVSIVAGGLAMWLMLATRTLHLPAGMGVLLIITNHASWNYFAVPAAGAIGLAAYAFLFFAFLRQALGAGFQSRAE
jgi:CBS-domain-containing membrane protein